MTIDELELLRAEAEGKPDYSDEVICYSEALRNAAPALIALVNAAKECHGDEYDVECEICMALKALDEVKL